MAAGSIIIDLLMKTGAFETDTKRAEKALAKLKKEAADAGKKIGIAFVAAGTAAAAMVKSSIDTADATSKAAQATGTTVESFSALTYAADLSGLSQEGLASAMVKLTKNMSDAAQGTGEAIKGFTALGISVKDSNGNLKGSDAMLAEVADKFAAMEDGAGKTALAVSLFGKTGAQLIPMLNAGAAGIDDLKKEAAELGLVLSTETARSAEEFNDTLTKIQGVARGLANRVMADLLPMLNNLATQFFESAKGAGALDQAARIAATGVKLLVSAGAIIGGVFKTIGEALGGLAATLVEFFSGNFKNAFNIAKATTFDFVGNIKGTASTVGSIWDEQAAKSAAGADGNAKKLAAPIMQADSKIRNAGKSIRDEAQRIFESVEKMIAGISRDVATFGQTDTQVKLFDLTAAGASPEQISRATEYLATLDRLRKAQEETQAATEKAAELQRDIGKVYDDTRTPAEKLANEIDRLNKLREGGLDFDTYSRAMFKAQDDFDAATQGAKQALSEMDEFAKNAAENIQKNFGDTLFNAMQGKFEGIGDSFVAMLQRMVAEALAAKLARAMFGEAEGGGVSGTGGFFGTALSTLGGWMGFGGARAGGGDVLPNRAYLVGEDGPEPFVPRTAGTILPTSVLAGSGSSGRQAGPTYINVGVEGRVDRTTRMQTARDIGRELRRSQRYG